jgi:pimeloyl-ACP methyl ester carboxylesterase
MIDRRTLNLGIGAIAIGALATRATAQIAFTDPGTGPWTDSHMVQRPGGQLHYATLGNAKSDRPPVILLHKLGGWMQDWRHVAPALAEDRYVIAFDLPGHGGSQWEGKAPYLQTIGESAALLMGAFDELGLKQVDLIGTSLGGCISVPMAAFWPERIHKLALVSCALGPARSLKQIVEIVDKPQLEKKMFNAGGDPFPILTGDRPNTMGHVNLAAINAEQNVSRRKAGRWIQPSERGVGITDIRGLLSRIEARTLLLYGDQPNSYLQFRSAAETELRNSRTEYIPNSGAFVMQDNPPATIKALKNFLVNG